MLSSRHSFDSSRQEHHLLSRYVLLSAFVNFAIPRTLILSSFGQRQPQSGMRTPDSWSMRTGLYFYMVGRILTFRPWCERSAIRRRAPTCTPCNQPVECSNSEYIENISEKVLCRKILSSCNAETLQTYYCSMSTLLLHRN